MSADYSIGSDKLHQFCAKQHCRSSASNREMRATSYQNARATDNATNPDDNGAAIGSIVARAAAAVGCRPPRISIRSMRNACYNPLAHRIAVSSRLVRDLPADLLEVLIAHEVGHAAQRREILSDAARVLPWSLGVLLLTLLATALLALEGASILAGAVGVVGIATASFTEKRASRKWQVGYLRREMQADAFANHFTGREHGTAEMLKYCAAIEDHGSLSCEAQARISAVKARTIPSCTNPA